MYDSVWESLRANWKFLIALAVFAIIMWLANRPPPPHSWAAYAYEECLKTKRAGFPISWEDCMARYFPDGSEYERRVWGGKKPDEATK